VPRPNFLQKRPWAAHPLRVLGGLTVGLLLIGLVPFSVTTADPTGQPTLAVPSPSQPTPTSTPVISTTATASPGQRSSASADEDGEPGVVVMPTCVGQNQPAEAEVNTSLYSFDGRTFEWILEYNGQVLTRETFVWRDDGAGPKDFHDLSPGRYNLSITLLDEARVVAAAEFEVIGCVTTQAGCRTVTFFNPSSNPAVTIKYGGGFLAREGGDEEVDDARKINLPSGESRTVDTLRESLSWSATPVVGSQRPVAVDEEAPDVRVPQHCGDTMTRGIVGCASARGAVVDLWFSPPGGRRATFTIMEAYDVMKSGSVRAGGHLRTTLPAGFYTLRVYTSAAVLPYERVRFEVVPCLRTRLTCAGVTFTNPSMDFAYSVRYSFGSGPDMSVRLGWKKSKKVHASSTSVHWEATPELNELPELWTIDAGKGAARLPSNCGR
jgi:hypothetical protein